MSKLFALIGLLIISFGCTSTEVTAVQTFSTAQVDVRGSFCTSPPAESDFPVRILFAVDSSDSMNQNDPSNKHVDAIEQAIANFAGQDSVKFGIIRWGEEIVQELVDYSTDTNPELFTNDQVILGQALTRMRQTPAQNPKKYLGGTNYTLALDAIYDYIIADLILNPTNAVTGRYYVEFITDGLPAAGGADAVAARADILSKVQALADNFPARLDVTQIVEFALVPPEFIDLLPVMAETGDGTYIQLSTPEALGNVMQQILSANLFVLEYDLQTLVVLNSQARLVDFMGDPAVLADSDADGIVDVEEIDNGSNPSKADTDGDGLGDYFETIYAGEFDARARNIPELTAEQLSDVDRDGINSFIEDRLGTNSTLPDTDGDGLTDGTEFLFNTNPKISDMQGDYDGDQVSNIVELRQGTNPRLDETEEVRRNFRQTFSPDAPPFAEVQGRRCYNFWVEKIPLVATLAAINPRGQKTPKGYNSIHIERLEKPVVETETFGPLLNKFRAISGSTWVIYRPDEGMRDPNAVELTVRDYHFEP